MALRQISRIVLHEFTAGKPLVAERRLSSMAPRSTPMAVRCSADPPIPNSTPNPLRRIPALEHSNRRRFGALQPHAEGGAREGCDRRRWRAIGHRGSYCGGQLPLCLSALRPHRQRGHFLQFDRHLRVQCRPQECLDQPLLQRIPVTTLYRRLQRWIEQDLGRRCTRARPAPTGTSPPLH